VILMSNILPKEHNLTASLSQLHIHVGTYTCTYLCHRKESPELLSLLNFLSRTVKKLVLVRRLLKDMFHKKVNSVCMLIVQYVNPLIISP